MIVASDTILKLVKIVVEILGDIFPELKQHEARIGDIIAAEEVSFGKTLVKGIEKFKKAAQDVQGRVLSGQDAFILWDTYGFPLDLTQLMAEERGLTVDVEGFNIAMDEGTEKSRSARNEASSDAIRVGADDKGYGYLVAAENLEPLPSFFLSFDTMREAWEVYIYLVNKKNPNIIKAHQIISHENKWLVGLENSETIESHFRRRMTLWKEGSSTEMRSWFGYISSDFTKIFRSVLRILLDGVDDKGYVDIYSNQDKSLLITIPEGLVRFLPPTAGEKSEKLDLDKIQGFMSKIIGLPFDKKHVLDGNEFDLPYEIFSFLFHLSNENLNYMGARFLIGAPFLWTEDERLNFIVNIDYLIKGQMIDGNLFNVYLDKDKELLSWMDSMGNHTVFKAIIDYSNTLGFGTPYEYSVDIVPFCTNTLRHYGDRKYFNHRGCIGYVNRIDIIAELIATFPDLHVRLYEGLVSYALMNTESRSLFDYPFTKNNI
ncbi:hypothetical protein GQ457_04G008650 [Hibiscus cannabinus]